MSSINTTPPRAFVRESTGLVKEAGAYDLFVFNLGNQNIGLGVAFLFLALGIYPGGNFVLGALIAMVLVLPSYFSYSYMSAVMPRSGGDYVWLSRIIHPAVGFATSWNWSIGMYTAIGWPMVFLVLYGFAPTLRGLGAFSHNPALVAAGDVAGGDMGIFIIGTICLALFTYLMIRGVKFYFRIQNFAFAFAIISVVLVAGIMLFTPAGAFPERFNDYVAGAGGVENAYQVVLAEAAPDLQTNAPFSLSATLLAAVWTLYMINFGLDSCFMGGEVKNPHRSQRIGMIGSMLVCGGSIALLVGIFINSLGSEWLSALSLIDPTVIGLSFTPTYNELAAIMTGNVVMATIVNFCFIFWTYLWMPVNFIAVTRNMLAWSFDRMWPERLAQVSDRYHTPVASLVTAGVVGWLFLIGFLWGPFSLLAGIAGAAMSIAMGCLAAIFLPYKMPEVFEASPVNQRWGNIPVITIVGVLGFLGIVFCEVLYWIDPSAGIAGNPTMVAYNLGVFFSGYLIYYIIKTVQKGRGIDITLAFDDIPPE